MVRADNAEELVLMAEGIGAEVIRGAVRYPEREDAKALIERRLREHRQEKEPLIRDVEEWLQQRRRGGCQGTSG